MRNINEIKGYMGTWSMLTFSEGVNTCWELKNNEGLRNQTIDVICKLGLTDKKMDGDSVTGLPYLDEQDGLELSFVEIFNKCTNFISPVCYLAKATETAYNYNYGIGIIARALRAFPAFLRELDLAYKIENSEFGKAHNLQCISSIDQDMNEHADLKIDYNQNTYRIWSYQNSYWSIKNARAKVRGLKNRVGKDIGDLLSGFHILFPIDIFNENEREDCYKWYFYSQPYVSSVISHFFQPDYPYTDYDIIKNMNDTDLDEYLKRPRIFKVI